MMNIKANIRKFPAFILISSYLGVCSVSLAASNNFEKPKNNSYVLSISCVEDFVGRTRLSNCFHGSKLIINKKNIARSLKKKKKDLYLSGDFSLNLKVAGFGVKLVVIIKDPNKKVLFNEQLKPGEGLRAEYKRGQFKHNLTRGK